MDSDNAGQSRSRRRVLQTGAAVAGLTIAGCLGGSDDTITFLSRGGSTQEAEREIMEEWTAESDITVEHQEAPSDQEMIQMIAENPGSIDFTNFAASGLGLARGQHDGELLADIDYGEIPNYEEHVQDEWQSAPPIDGHDDGIAYHISTHGLAYSTEMVEEEPTSWDIALESEYDGHVVFSDIAYARFGVGAAHAGLDVNEALDDEDLREEVYDQLRDHHELVTTYWASGDEFMRYLQEEQAALSTAWGGRIEQLQEDGYPVDYTIPEEGAPSFSSFMAVAEESDNKEHVYDFLNWYYEPEHAVQHSLNYKYPTPLEDPPEELTELLEYVEDPDELLWMDFQLVFEHLDEIEQSWDEIKTE
ncbi:extracellular solute-binding protein [Natronorubrum sediminis]|uniref:Extracellular solute-binding protein n=1 Tax=Natronorubrum sediminis TaxID=640943 RepID=A0A1H6G492_9EURY|nr:PotD/PotF family extracellular solute-binding protein [Natronorubrum sediminis]SEH17258.1 extracellular solute-binding protein [Natronorubrum sediminis]